MDEKEWLASEDPKAMLGWMDREMSGDDYYPSSCPQPVKVSERKLRLFACACCLLRGTSPEVVDEYERNGAPMDETDGYRMADHDWAVEWARPSVNAIQTPTQVQKAHLLRDIVGNPFHPVPEAYQGKVLIPANNPKQKYGLYAGIGLLPVVHYLTPTVVSLAQAAYDERGTPCPGHSGLECCQTDLCPVCGGRGRVGYTLDPARLLVLSDALEEAGCVDEVCPECKGVGTYNVQTTNVYLSEINGYSPFTLYDEWRGCRHCGGDDRTKGTGCVMNPVLAHLRGWERTWAGTYTRSTAHPVQHVRGCWVLDLLLEKE